MKSNKKGAGIPVGVLTGVLVDVMIMLLSAFVLAWLITAEKMPLDAAGYAAAIVLFLSAFSGALAASKIVKRLRAQICLMTGGAYYLILLVMTAVFFGGQYRDCGIAAILVSGGCGSAALLGIKEKKTRKGKMKNRAFC